MRIDRWKVKQAMGRVGIQTFKELADRVDVSQQTVSAWFRGAGFTSDNLATLCYVLNCSPNDILTLDPNQVAPVVEPKANSILETVPA